MHNSQTTFHVVYTTSKPEKKTNAILETCKSNSDSPISVISTFARTLTFRHSAYHCVCYEKDYIIQPYYIKVSSKTNHKILKYI